jgi:hypothetical protein
MEDEFVHNNPQNPTKEILERLEAYVVDINHNMNLLVASLACKIRPFKDDGGSN